MIDREELERRQEVVERLYDRLIAGEDVVTQYEEAVRNLHDLQDELAANAVEGLRELVVHCWVHSGYRECGRDKMTSEQRAYFDDIVASVNT